MGKFIKNLTRKNEFYTFLLIVLLAAAIEIASGQFFTANNFVDILSAMIVPGLFAIAELTTPAAFFFRRQWSLSSARFSALSMAFSSAT